MAAFVPDFDSAIGESFPLGSFLRIVQPIDVRIPAGVVE